MAGVQKKPQWRQSEAPLRATFLLVLAVGAARMPSKRERFANSRAVAAVQWLEEVGEAYEAPKRAVNGPVHDAKTKPKGGRRGWANEPVGFFRLRDDNDAAIGSNASSGNTGAARPPPHRSQGSGAMAQLRDMFEGAFTEDVLASVLVQCNNDVARATEALLSFNDPHPPAASGASTSRGGAGGAATADAAPEAERSLWAMLPEDCKSDIIAKLSSRELSRAACVNREFAALARTRRLRASFVQPAPGLSLPALAGMLASHPNASKLVLTRLAQDLKHIVHFEDLADVLYKASTSAKRAVPFTHLQLRRCPTLEHSAVAALLEGAPALRELDFADCCNLTDDALIVISQHLPTSATDPLDALAHLDLEDDHPENEDEETVARHTKESSAVPRAIVAGRPVVFSGSLKVSPRLQQLFDKCEPAINDCETQLADVASCSRPPDEAAEQAESPTTSARERNAASVREGVMHLHLKGCKVSDKGIKALFGLHSTCRASLASLDVSKCSGVTHNSLSLIPPNSVLRNLKAEGCKGLAHITLALPAEHPLTEVSLNSSPSLKTVDIKADNLTVLTVTECKMLLSLTLRTPSLQVLMANQCSHLRELAVSARMPRLCNMNLMGCNMLPSAALTQALPFMPALKRLNVAACLTMTVLTIPAEVEIEHLSATGAFLRGLHVRAPSLLVLEARSCRYLESLSTAACPLSLDVRNCELLQQLSVGWERTPDGEPCRVLASGCRMLPGHALDAVRLCATVVLD